MIKIEDWGNDAHDSRTKGLCQRSSSLNENKNSGSITVRPSRNEAPLDRRKIKLATQEIKGRYDTTAPRTSYAENR